MKKTLLFLSLCLIVANAFSQAPLSFQYQAVVRDDTGQPLANEEVELTVHILMGSHEGSPVFSETHYLETNAFGLVNIQVGSQESMENINWDEGIYFVEIIVDGNPMGATQLLSVPYALHAHSSADAFSGDYDELENTPDLENLVELDDPTPGDMLVYTGDGWQAIPIGEEDQVLAVMDGMPSWIEPPHDNEGDEEGTVSDIDGNVYQTVIIGDQEWMAENLRTTSYADGSSIPHLADDGDWSETTGGAYAVFPHDMVTGIDSEEEMLEAYGALYNWYAVVDDRALCPDGWHVPTDDDWTTLTSYLIDNYDDLDNFSVANALKSCRQVNSPLGGDCDTNEHPRWESHNSHYGTDDFDFSALPGGFRNDEGVFNHVGNIGSWFSSTEATGDTAHGRDIYRFSGQVSATTGDKQAGGSIRCLKSD